MWAVDYKSTPHYDRGSEHNALRLSTVSLYFSIFRSLDAALIVIFSIVRLPQK